MKRWLCNGYWEICIPEHPRARSNGCVYEHIVLAEKMLGRPLVKGEQIHHMGKQDDNSRIKVCETLAEHRRLHVRLRAVRAGALPSWRKCGYCKQYDRPSNLSITESHVFHRACHKAYMVYLRLRGNYDKNNHGR